jgi:8-oxo-dGTP diphosphatase
MRPQVGVGIAVRRGDEILLGKRKGSHGAGAWGFPGGHLEFGESIEDCARRELREETGLEALAVKTGSWTSDVFGEGKHYVTLFTEVVEFKGELELLEPHKCETWQWFSKEALPSPLFPPVTSFFAKEAEAVPPHVQVLHALNAVYAERDWGKFHSPKNLVMDLASEAGELLDLFRWMTEEESYTLDPKTRQEVADEIADVFKAILYLSHKLQIDPIESTHQKLEKLKRKYPADRCRGSALKYTAYES